MPPEDPDEGHKAFLPAPTVYRADSHHIRARTARPGFREESATHLKRSAASRYPARENNLHRHYESTIRSDDDAAGRKGMQHELAFLEDEKDQPAHSCHLASKLTSTLATDWSTLRTPRGVANHSAGLYLHLSRSALTKIRNRSRWFQPGSVTARSGSRKVVRAKSEDNVSPR